MIINWQLLHRNAQESGMPFHEVVSTTLDPDMCEGVIEDLREGDYAQAAVGSALISELVVGDGPSEEPPYAEIFAELADFIAMRFLWDRDPVGYIRVLDGLSKYYSAAGMVTHARALGMSALQVGERHLECYEHARWMQNFVADMREARGTTYIGT